MIFKSIFTLEDYSSIILCAYVYDFNVTTELIPVSILEYSLTSDKRFYCWSYIPTYTFIPNYNNLSTKTVSLPNYKNINCKPYTRIKGVYIE